MDNHIYLDFNASTPLRDCVQQGMIQAMQDYGNPSSIHKQGRASKARIDNARDIIADHLEVSPSQIIFTSGGTEANNLAISAAYKNNYTILKSAIEHESVSKNTLDCASIPVLKSGVINLPALEELLKTRKTTTLVSIMLANNETGVIQPIDQVVSLARQYGAKVHCDAVTAFTKVPFSFKNLTVDYLTISAHKIGGPKGCGALIIPLDEQLPPSLLGGNQEKGHRAGTENVLGIVGFACAVEDSKSDDWRVVESLRDHMESVILKGCSAAKIYGSESPRLPNTTFIGMPNIPAHTQLMAFDLEGFSVSSGSACSSGKVSPSHVLQAMGYTSDDSSQAIRISLGWSTTRKEVELFARTWLNLYNRYQTNG